MKIHRDIKIELVKRGNKIRLIPLPGQGVPEQYIRCSRKARRDFEPGHQFIVDLEESTDTAGRRHLSLSYTTVLNQLNLFDDGSKGDS